MVGSPLTRMQMAWHHDPSCVHPFRSHPRHPILVATNDSDRVKHAVEAVARVGAHRKGRNHGQ